MTIFSTNIICDIRDKYQVCSCIVSTQVQPQRKHKTTVSVKQLKILVKYKSKHFKVSWGPSLVTSRFFNCRGQLQSRATDITHSTVEDSWGPASVMSRFYNHNLVSQVYLVNFVTLTINLLSITGP